MNLNELEDLIFNILISFKVIPRRISISRNNSNQFLIDDFGIMICCINNIDYTVINSKVSKDFEDWRVLYISTSDNIEEKRDEILWAFIRGGYIKWLRNTLSDSQFKNLILFNGLGEKIIKKRLEIWGTKPKYKYFIQDHISILQYGFQREFAYDPGFFDWLPEERGEYA